MIAMALSLEPKLIIADEPTTALDATVQAQIIDLLLRLQADYGTALLMITHDLGVVADIADDVMVMYAGRAAEKAPKRDVFYAPHHPYTKGLLESIPSSSAAGARLRPIAGTPPSLINLPSGCKFHPRCGYVLDRCLKEEPDAPAGRRDGPALLGLLAAHGGGRAFGGGGGTARGSGDRAARRGSGRGGRRGRRRALGIRRRAGGSRR